MTRSSSIQSHSEHVFQAVVPKTFAEMRAFEEKGIKHIVSFLPVPERLRENAETHGITVSVVLGNWGDMPKEIEARVLASAGAYARRGEKVAVCCKNGYRSARVARALAEKLAEEHNAIMERAKRLPVRRRGR